MYQQQQQKELQQKQSLAAAEKAAAAGEDLGSGRELGPLSTSPAGPGGGAAAGPVLNKQSSGSASAVGLAGPASRLEKKLLLLSEEDARVLLVRLYTMIRYRDC
jgi:hypothetical protein